MCKQMPIICMNIYIYLYLYSCNYIHSEKCARAHTHNEMPCYCSWMQVDRNGCPSREISRIRKLALNCQQACWPYRVSNQTDSIFFQVNDLKVKLAWQWQNGTEHVPHSAVTKSLLIYLCQYFSHVCLFDLTLNEPTLTGTLEDLYIHKDN